MQRLNIGLSFDTIIKESSADVFGVAYCNKCFVCLLYKKKNGGKVSDYGTKHLSDHQKNVRQSRYLLMTELKVTSSFKRLNAVLKPSDVKVIRHSQALLTAGAHLSFNFNGNKHFLAFSECMIGIGAKDGNLEAEKAFEKKYYS